MLFTNGINTEGIWSLPADGNLGKVPRAARIVDARSRMETAAPFRFLRREEHRLRFGRNQCYLNGDDIFIFETSARKPRALTSSPLREYYPVSLRTGKRVAYRINYMVYQKGRPVFVIPEHRRRIRNDL